MNKIVETSSFEVQNLIVEFRQCRYVDRVVSQSFSVFPYSIAFQFDADNNLSLCRVVNFQTLCE
jgi:hypothetical protein